MRYPQKPIICIIGLGYVGLPLACLFAKKGLKVLGYDRDTSRIDELRRGYDRTGECRASLLKSIEISFFDDPSCICKAQFIIVAVPTPITPKSTPDLQPLISASETVGTYLQKNSIVVYESTVYPGVTEDICLPIVEEHSGLVCGKDWVIGYSPERVNPGDKVHTPDKIVKVTSGMDPKSSAYIDSIYRLVIKAGTFSAKNIRTAEAAKVIENTQRDVNIAIINEFSQVFDACGVDTRDVIEAASTKWNFLPFKPGFVGGHCISVDPYYLIHRSRAMGYNPKLLAQARTVNNSMPLFCANKIIRERSKLALPIPETRVLILGATFKENVNDFRNSLIPQLIQQLNRAKMIVYLYDPHIDTHKLPHNFSAFKKHIITELPSEKLFDVIVYAVNHDEFARYSLKDLATVCHRQKILFDVCGRFHHDQQKSLFTYAGL